MKLFLYSAQPFLKYYINQRFYTNRHYVWCSEVHDGRQADKLSISSTLGRSSNPAEICADLKEYARVNRADRHCDHIVRWKASIPNVAHELCKDGKISDEDLQNITYAVINAEVQFWRPLLYVIDRDAVKSRTKLVAPELRAGLADEYIIADLSEDEFEVVEY